MRFAISSSRVCLPREVRPAVIVIDGGKIEAIHALKDFAGDVPCEHLGDLLISPGVIDSHVHINDPGTDWEGFETATAAAAAGGVTTLIDMPLNSDPVTTTVESLDAKREAAKAKCRVDVGFYGGIVPSNLTDLASLIESGVLGIKSFLCDSGLDAFPATTETDLRMALPILKKAGVPLLVHAELVTPLEHATDDPDSNKPDERSYLAYMKSRPDEWEENAIRVLIGLAQEFETPIHVVHVATGKVAAMIAKAKLDNLPITFETCPHYLFFESSQVVDGDTRFKCAPPIRTNENQRMLRVAVLEGWIDTIGSDHSPCPPNLKSLDTGNFQTAWGGIAGLQFSLSVMETIAQLTPRKIPFFRLSKMMSENPAKLLGLENSKGRIEPGLDADLVIWNPDEATTVSMESCFHRHKVSPYEGQSLYGTVHRTYVRGQLVFQNGNLIGEPIGKLLRRPKNTASRSQTT